MEQKFDSSLLQFVPKGSYYNTDDAQMKAIEKIWNSFFKKDRTIFALSTLLPGTAYSKGRMNHLLLSHPAKSNNDLLTYNLPPSFEEQIIMWNLNNDDMAKSMKNLLMLTHKETGRVNNSRTRKIILRYLFERSNDSLEAMALKFKAKMARLVRHAIGKDLPKVISGKEFQKYIGRYNKDALPVIRFLFNDNTHEDGEIHFEKLALYEDARKCAEKKDVKGFAKIAEKKILPLEVLIGFRNTYKLDFDKSILYENGKMSDKQKIQNVRAAEKTSAKVEVNYNKQDVYDLWKLFYLKTLKNESTDIDKIAGAIEKQTEKTLDIDLGKVVVIFDASKSMEGSEKRAYHPLLTGLSLVSKLNNVMDVIYVGGKKVKTNSEKIPAIIMPSGSTELWKALIQAADKNPDTILVVSDGYENSIKGAFNAVYETLKKSGKKFNLLHVNPVFAAEVSGVRSLAENVKPMVLDNYQYLKTNIVFELINSDKELVKKMLMNEYHKQIEEAKNV